MPDELKIGIIGVGQIGKVHLKKWGELPGVKVVAACDSDAAELDRVCKEFAIPRRFERFRDLLALPDVAAVDVCLHNNLHAPVSIAALEAGKHVYCEKPLAGSYVDARRMVEAVEKTGRMLHMQLATLYSMETRAAKRFVDDGNLGRIYYAKSSSYRRRGRPYVDGYGTPRFVQKAIAAGGALYDMGVYHIGQVLYLLGNPAVRTISGATYQETGMYEERRAGGKYDVEELGLGLARLEGGAALFIEEAWAIHLGGTDGSKIAGTKGGLTLGPPLVFHTTQSDVELNATMDLAAAEFRWGKCIAHSGAYRHSQDHWAAALRGEVPLLPTAAIGLATMLISEGIYLSQKLGREVTPEEVMKHSVSTALAP
jgi:predicted dehydrogenase